MPHTRAASLVLAAIPLFLAVPAAAQDWTLIVLPDTQHYVDSSANYPLFNEQTEWVVDNLGPLNIEFVSHVGDVVDTGTSSTQWTRAMNALGVIHGEVPYSVSLGDHDYDVEETHGGTTNFTSRLGSARYAGFPWYGGASPTQRSHYQFFSAGGRQFLHLNVEWEMPDAELNWAKSILTANPTTPTIITTHGYLTDQPGLNGRTNFSESDSSQGNNAEHVWTELVRNSPQVFMVLCGNYHAATSQYDPDDPAGPSRDGEFHQVSTNLHGLPVYEMLSDYQDYPNGGDGWLRILTFQSGGGAGGSDRIRVQTYSPTLDAYQLDNRSDFFFDLDFAERFDNLPEPFPLQRITVTTGSDTTLKQGQPNTAFGSEDRLRIDADESSDDTGPRHALIRFDLTNAANQLPEDAVVVSAQLRVRLTDAGSGFSAYRMTQSWSDATATWNSLGGGVLPGTNAASAPTRTATEELRENETPSDTHRSIFDLTTVVKSWLSGVNPNFGLGLVPLGTDQLNLESFNGSTRPQLVIDYYRTSDLP